MLKNTPYELDDDPASVDVNAVSRFMATQAYGHRGQGLGKAIVREMIESGPGAGFRWMLHTADAHDMYLAFGFGEPDATSMERPSQRVRDEAATRSG